MMLYKKSVLFLYFIFIVFNLRCQDLFNYTNTLRYANYLFNSKQYELSAVEYERITFLAPNDTLSRLRLIQSYRLQNDFENAKTRLDFFISGNIELCPEEFARENFRILFENRQYATAFQFLNENKTIDQSPLLEYRLGVLLMQNKWLEAKTFAEENLNSFYKTDNLKSLYNISQKGMNIKKKKPVCAAILSTVLPGSGKVYTKHWKDGIFSFLLITASSWLTYHSVDQSGLDLKSVVFGTITIGFYSANIYGSYKSATDYNTKAYQIVTRDVEKFLFDD